MKSWPLAFLFLALSSSASPSVLNVQGFAGCLSAVSPAISLSELKSIYQFSDEDLLIFYLAAYPGEKLPHVPVSLQAKANQDWGVRFDSQSLLLAQSFLNLPPRTPQDAFGAGLKVCAGDVFCAALSVQNVLRTLGRYPQSIITVSGVTSDENPAWFKNNQQQWIAAIPSLEAAMISLRRGGSQSDLFGDWYHTFGILAYSIEEMVIGHPESFVTHVVHLNDRLDKELTGDSEDAVKAQIDQDTVAMSWEFLSGLAASADCTAADAYSL